MTANENAPTGSIEDAAWQQLLQSALQIVDVVVTKVARRRRLQAADADDLASMVRVKLLSNDAAALRKFQGRSTLQTFTVVVQRYCSTTRPPLGVNGGRRQPQGVRPCRHAAGTSDRSRQPPSTTRAILESQYRLSIDRRVLARVHARFKPRLHRTFVDLEGAGQPVEPQSADHRIETAWREAVGLQVASALRSTLQSQAPEDLRILTMRFKDGLSIAAIARAVSLDQKALYRRIARLLRKLEHGLKVRGVARSEALEALNGWVSTPAAVQPAMMSMTTETSQCIARRR